MKKIPCLVSLALFGFALAAPAFGALEVKHVQTEKSIIGIGVWAGDTFYLSGQLCAPYVSGDAPLSPGVYGDTQAQTLKVLTKIKGLLAQQGLGMGDVVMMRVYMAGDPAHGGKMDFAGMNAAYSQFFGTKDQPNKPARTAVRVAELVAPWALVEVEVQAVRSK